MGLRYSFFDSVVYFSYLTCIDKAEFLLWFIFDSIMFACVLQRSKSDACDEQIQDEVQRHIKKCVCPKQYHMHKITDGQYRVRPSNTLCRRRLFIISVTAAAAAAGARKSL